MENMRIRPGPLNNELLFLETSHRAYNMFYGKGNAEEVLDARRGDLGLCRKIRDNDIPNPVMNYIRRAGFEGMINCGFKPLDHALMTALVERWRPETHMFHLPIGEVTITLQDVQLIWTNRWGGGYRTGAQLKMPFIRTALDTPFSDNPTNEQYFDKCGGLSWGSAVLACLYRNLCKAACKEKIIAGPLMLLQLWAWSRIRVTAPKYECQNPGTPYGVKWNNSLHYDSVPKHAVLGYRTILCAMMDGEQTITTRDEFYDSGEEEDSDDDDDEGTHVKQGTSPSLHDFSQWDTHPDRGVIELSRVDTVPGSSSTRTRSSLKFQARAWLVWNCGKKWNCGNRERKVKWVTAAGVESGKERMGIVEIGCLDSITPLHPDTEADDSDPVFGDEEEDEMDFWSAKASNVIRTGMYFCIKQELIQAIKGWHISQHRELVVLQSTLALWTAVCYTQNPRNNTEYPTSGAPCNWQVRATKKKRQGLWQIRTWVAAHICYETVIAHNNRSLKSSVIAVHILHLIRANIAYVVKQIQADIKNNMHVDISYIKGWRARKKAIDNIYGSWERNFKVLPRYIHALETSNPNTVVVWSHDPNSLSSINTFKYVFWAFRPAIEAFTRCIPVICVDGTHVKGSYKGKLLIAVTKNANNHILPLAYAIVDEETMDSWNWFFKQLRWHNGILNAMSNLDEWKKPIAYHQFCLRHIQSNFMRQFKSYRPKKLCYEMGCTLQKRKYLLALKEIKEIDPAAWEYLKEISTSKWTLLRDSKNCRWGNPTTNIAESFNNVLRGARVFPIKALIDFTFNKAVQHLGSIWKSLATAQVPCPYVCGKNSTSATDMHKGTQLQSLATRPHL
ncbi:hypothetical protein OSB04_012793 [Centaurea solstitialis]|uniref:Aminotransferase-like plant mobile domain-containing protein n=1 Tax=Centaurea solstitialis TaxID=347529 RepID=A0AA38TC11_9ASTR|nr:hypothetical protein OSB04_012793 [Centaurea solstitialis]